MDFPLRRWEYRVVLFPSDDTSHGLEKSLPRATPRWSGPKQNPLLAPIGTAPTA